MATMSTRPIESFFTRSAPSARKPATSSSSGAFSSTLPHSPSSPSSAPSASSLSSNLKRTRDNDEGAVTNGNASTGEEETGEAGRAAKKVKGDEEEKSRDGVEEEATTSTASTVPVVSSTTTTVTVSGDGSSSSSTSHWTASLPSLLDPTWQLHLRAEFTKPYFARLCASLLSASAKGAVYPPSDLVFAAFQLTPFPSVKVVILGQDPYHDTDQAEGLAFSVPPPIRPPSSLQNMYKELKADVGFVPPKHGSLRKWAAQGVLLLNTSLTVTAHAANSHKGFGWEHFTDAVIAALNKDAKGVVFLLWGAHAQKKAANINTARHHVLKAAHPSGLSANRGFFGCRHFSQCNALLKKEGNVEIDWQL